MSYVSPSFALVNGGFSYLYTNSLDRRRYDVQRKPVYQEWIDANNNYHRETTRQRVSGTVHLGFRDKAVYDTFLSRLSAGRSADGYNGVKLLILNSGTTETINAFLMVTAKGEWDVVNQREWYDVTVKIEER